ncbi:MAG: hypothetical protein V4519_04795 [Patescibacteria group bacterium]
MIQSTLRQFALTSNDPSLDLTQRRQGWQPSWMWVRMGDLVQAVNSAHPELSPFDQKIWTGKELGNTFAEINRIQTFWFVMEGYKEPQYENIVRGIPPRNIPFDQLELFVPAVWAEQVFAITRKGITAILWMSNKPYGQRGTNIVAIDEILKAAAA